MRAYTKPDNGHHKIFEQSTFTTALPKRPFHSLIYCGSMEEPIVDFEQSAVATNNAIPEGKMP